MDCFSIGHHKIEIDKYGIKITHKKYKNIHINILNDVMEKIIERYKMFHKESKNIEEDITKNLYILETKGIRKTCEINSKYNINLDQLKEKGYNDKKIKEIIERKKKDYQKEINEFFKEFGKEIIYFLVGRGLENIWLSTKHLSRLDVFTKKERQEELKDGE